MEKKRPRRRGRPLSYDREQVLDAAVQVFWKQGYEGATVDDLTRAMGISPPSLYSEFGNKHGLFLQAIDRYVETITSTQVAWLTEERDLEEAIAGYLRQVIRCVASQDWPAGCLVVSVAAEASVRDEEVRSKVAGLLDDAEALIARRIAEAKPDSEALPLQDPQRLARMIVALGQGLAARARGGVPQLELLELADDFMRSTCTGWFGQTQMTSAD